MCDLNFGQVMVILTRAVSGFPGTFIPLSAQFVKSRIDRNVEMSASFSSVKLFSLSVHGYNQKVIW
jgi:hypothetical protein